MLLDYDLFVVIAHINIELGRGILMITVFTFFRVPHRGMITKVSQQ